MSDYTKGTTYTTTYRVSTPKEMVASFQAELAKTPKRRFLKRQQLKRNIRFWSEK